jgi:hypothetical protein
MVKYRVVRGDSIVYVRKWGRVLTLFFRNIADIVCYERGDHDQPRTIAIGARAEFLRRDIIWK